MAEWFGYCIWLAAVGFVPGYLLQVTITGFVEVAKT